MSNFTKTKKIKILATMPTNMYGYAGAEKVVFNVLFNLDKNKFDIYLVEILRINNSFKPGIIKVHTKFGTKYQIKARRGLKAIPSLAKIIKKINPDIIYSNVPHINFDTLLAKWLSFSRAKFISCVHGVNLNSFIDKISLYFPSVFSSKIITVSNEIRELLIKKYKINSNKVVTIYNPVINFKELDIKMSKKDPLKDNVWMSKKFNILFVGRLEKEKGVNYLIKAIDLIVHKFHRKDIRLTVVGEGSLRKELTKLVVDYKLAKYIFFVGWQDDVFRFLKKSDILCLPSLFEGLPTVLIEALVCGTPIVSTDCGGSVEVLENGKYGLLVNKGNPKELARGILKLLDNSELRKKYSQIGKIRAMDFDIRKIVPQYEKLFENIVKGA